MTEEFRMIYRDADNFYTWLSFLEVISVERAEPFLQELGFPGETNHYSEVRRLARACLEVYIFAAMCSGLRDSTELIPSWKEYRQQRGELSENEFLASTEEHGKGMVIHEKIALVYARYEERLGTGLGEKLDEWFVNHYKPIESGFEVVPLAILWLLKEGRMAASLTMEQDEIRLVGAFCDSYYAKQSKIRSKFLIAENNAKLEGPSLWEAVLQTFPADSVVGENYPWLAKLCKCFVLRALRTEWRQLRDQLGEASIIHLSNLVRQEATENLGVPNLPFEILK